MTHPTDVPAVEPERPVVDADGAGDAFVSGFLHRHPAGAPEEDRVPAGAVAGACARTAAGTRTAFAGPAGPDRVTAATAARSQDG